jgi:hypothetical protein
MLDSGTTGNFVTPSDAKHLDNLHIVDDIHLLQPNGTSPLLAPLTFGPPILNAPVAAPRVPTPKSKAPFDGAPFQIPLFASQRPALSPNAPCTIHPA